jgi:DNA invertase Pin-like site-specific DNA recombinase
VNMAEGKFVSYLRVSTIKQGRSGLGLEAQRAAVETFLDGGRWKIIEEFVETESGKRDDRPALHRALTSCRIHDATLLIAKLDRLSRDAAFLLNLQKAGVRFVACDMPEADNFTVGIFALLAQKERELISSRTREALAAAKRRGVKLGGDRGNLPSVARQGTAASAQIRSRKAHKRADDLMQIIEPLRAAGRSISAIAADLNAKGIPTARGHGWQPTQVSRVIARSHNPKSN